MLLYHSLSRYHVATLLSELALVSPHLLLSQHHLGVCFYIGEFATTADPVAMNSYEIKNGYLWSTFLPYIKLAYLPNTPCCEPVLLSKMQVMAVRTAVIALQSMLASEEHREVLVREGLVDFLTCMPWYTTGPAEERARDLVEMIQQAPDMKLQPPSLLNMAKACVAKHYCGLPTVVEYSVPDILQLVCS